MSAFVTTRRLVLEQEAVADTSGEVAAIPVLLKRLAPGGGLDVAATLGLPPWRIFLKVELPILFPAIVSSLILAFTELPRSIFLHGATMRLPIFQWADS